MFSVTLWQDGPVTVRSVLRILFVYLIISSTFTTALLPPVAEVSNNATETTTTLGRPIIILTSHGSPNKPETAHVEQSETGFAGVPAVSTAATVNAPHEQSSVATTHRPAETPKIPHLESSVDPSATAGDIPPIEPNSPFIEMTVSGFDSGTTPIAEQVGTSLAPSNPTHIITAGSSTVEIAAATSGGFIIGSQTVGADQTVNVAGTPIVVQTSNGQTQILVAGSTVAFPTVAAAAQITAPPSLAPLTVNSQTVSANSNSEFIFGTQTLRPGGPALTIDGTTLSLAPSATAVIMNGATSTLIPIAIGTVTTTAPPLLTLNGITYTANAATQYILGPGTTLTPGGAVTVSGTVVSLAPGESEVVVGGSTSMLGAVTTVITVTTPLTGGSSSGGAVTTTGTGRGVTTTGQSGGVAKATHSAGVGRVRGMGTKGWVAWVKGVVAWGIALAL